jgi:imidazolonepropionase-like amidohydrolase
MVADPKLDLGDPPIIKVSSPDEARALVARELVRKPDYIKVWFIHRAGDDLAVQEAIVKAAADSAHAAQIPLAVHATQLIVAKAALRAGADYLVHSVDDAPVDDEFLALAKRNRILYCPTLYVTSGYIEALSGTWQPTATESRLADPQIVASMGDIAKLPREAIPLRLRGSAVFRPQQLRIAMDNLRAVSKAGVVIVMGTDAGNIGTLHGPSVFREMALMQEAGLTPLQVLRAATSNGARVARREDEMGAIVPGRLADMVVLDADPMATVGNLSHVYRVIKGGTVFDPDALVRSIR